MLKSLHGRLLAWLIVPLLFLSGALMVNAWSDTRSTAQAIFDRMLVTLALSISEHALASGGDLLTDELLELIRVTTNDNLYYKVIGPDSAFIMGYDDIPEPAGGIAVLEANVQFYDADYLGEPVRVIAVSTLVDRGEFSGWMTTFVAQTLRDRTEFANAILFDNGARVLLLVLIASILLSVGIAQGLRPLHRLQAAVARRDPHDLSPLRDQGLPIELHGLVQALNGLLRRLADHIGLTRRFVENASHQLRTPVAALLPQADLALRHAESERERLAVGRMRSSAERIARLTHQLLNLTYAEAVGLGEQAFDTVDLAALAQEAAERIQAAHPGVEVERDLAPAPMTGDALLLQEVLDNLLDNALRYGRPPIHVRVARDGDAVVLQVTDSGDGIPAAALDRVTERFFRAQTEAAGSGLGLAIASEIVANHGGRLHVANATGGGAQVTCRFAALV